MKKMRLESKDADIVQRLIQATSIQHRKIAVAAAEWALRKNGLNDLELISTIKALEQGGKLSVDDKSKLEALVEKFDDEYFQAEDSGATEEEYLQLFGKARAISALLFSGGDDSFAAAAEAIYEASVASDDEKSLFDLVRSHLP